jgi:two-component system OmpR family response regulator
MPAENTSPFKGQWGKQCGEDRHWLKLSRHSSACLGLAVRIRMRCLVIEDESITGHYICNGLKEAGHTPTLVRDGVSGLQLATSQSWDVVVLDRMLPGGVDGLSLLTKIRELGKTTPVLILSALASLDERLRGLRAGGDDYLTKPFAFSELLARLEALPRRNTMRTESSELRIADLNLI